MGLKLSFAFGTGAVKTWQESGSLVKKVGSVNIDCM